MCHKTKQLSLRITPSVNMRLEQVAKRTGRGVPELIRAYVSHGLDLDDRRASERPGLPLLDERRAG